MSEKFLFPCDCGKTTPVERRQAGTSVVCGCGKTLEVPTIRGFSSLVPAEGDEQDLPPIWGLRQGLIFLGLFIAVPAFVFAGYVSSQMPNLALYYEDIAKGADELTPLQTWAIWKQYDGGMPKSPTISGLATRLGIQSLRRQVNFGLAIGGVGTAIAIAALMVRPATKDTLPKPKT